MTKCVLPLAALLILAGRPSFAADALPPSQVTIIPNSRNNLPINPPPTLPPPNPALTNRPGIAPMPPMTNNWPSNGNSTQLWRSNSSATKLWPTNGSATGLWPSNSSATRLWSTNK